MKQDVLEFITKHNLNLDDFVDAKGLPVGQIRDEMKRLDKLFAYNTSACESGNHRIRDRHAHCIVCNTAAIAYMKRSRDSGTIYIAGSINKQIIKVGMTTEKIDVRILKLNSRKVGNTSDWVALKTYECHHVNSIELLVHSSLSKYKVTGDLYGKVESNELFRCSFDKADNLIEEMFRTSSHKATKVTSQIHDKTKYQFRNLVSSKKN